MTLAAYSLADIPAFILDTGAVSAAVRNAVLHAPKAASAPRDACTALAPSVVPAKLATALTPAPKAAMY